MEQVPKYIPNELRRFRKRMGYQQKDVAFLLGLKSAGRISEWEQGTSNPSIENLIKLAVIYRTLCDQLYQDVRKKFVPELVKREKALKERLTSNTARDTGG